MSNPIKCLSLSPHSSVKDKAEILLQVEELLHIKEELSSQVSNGTMREEHVCLYLLLSDVMFIYVFVQVTLLHGALEQERSKVKGLQTEQPKHQVS